jgi:hypothetical protein
MEKSIGGQRNMGWIEDNLRDNEGKFALTGCALVLQPPHHVLLPMACCLFIAKS